jgi:hypothetical protein
MQVVPSEMRILHVCLHWLDQSASVRVCCVFSEGFSYDKNGNLLSRVFFWYIFLWLDELPLLDSAIGGVFLS